MKVSIVVPTYNRAALVVRLLRSFDATTYGDDYEVVVVDDGSTDHTEDIVQSVRPTLSYQLQYVKQKNAGPAVARNTGVALSSSDILAFIDDDHIATPTWLAEIAEIEVNGQVVGQCGRNISLPGKTAVARYCSYRRLHEMPTVNPDGTVAHLMSGNAAILRWAFEAVGGFDSRYVPRLRGVAPGGEDTALSLALSKQGYLLRFNPNAVTYHAQKESFLGYLKETYNFGHSHRLYAIQAGRPSPAMGHLLQLARSLSGIIKYPPRDAPSLAGRDKMARWFLVPLNRASRPNRVPGRFPSL